MIDQAAELNGKILWSLARWIEETRGAAKLDEIAAEAGVPVEAFEGATYWLALAHVEKFLARARELCDDDAAFLKACGYRFGQSYGAMRFMVWALSELQYYEAAVKASKMMTRISRFEKVASTANSFTCRYYAERPESRLLCLTRQAAFINGPVQWNMPVAQFSETACVAHGDPYCEYHVSWYARRRLTPILGGSVVGFGFASFLAFLHVGLQLAGPGVTLPILGAALGYIYELRRTQAMNLKHGAEVHDVLRELGRAEAEARSEIVTLHQRQRDWIRLMEQQVTDRTETLERVVDGLNGLQQSRVSTLRGFSHDLRNPLFVVKGNVQYLRERYVQGEDGEALHDMEVAVNQIEAMLANLMEVATKGPGFVKLAPKPLHVAPLTDVFRRRLKALVHGRDIKVSVFCTREAPSDIVVDPLVFDRVVDNLLTNAAKYTHRGSIILEIGGTPSPAHVANDSTPEGYLTLKLSDTGEGISPQQVDAIFRPRPVTEPVRPNSYGIGLSSVVRLLAQIGGRIDVMTKPGVGTTFWAHFPVHPPVEKIVVGEENLESMITRVVTIRKVEGV